MNLFDHYLVEAEYLSHPFETAPITSFKVANKVYKRWQSDPDVNYVRLIKCTNQGRINIEI